MLSIVEIVKDHWRDVLLVVLVLTVMFMKQTIELAKANSILDKKALAEVIEKMDKQNKQILDNKVDYEAKLKELPKEVIKIETKYVTRYKTIETIKEDKNATCEQLIDTLNNYTY